MARLGFAANLLREHRGDGHVVALTAERIDRTEAHVLLAIDAGIEPPVSFGRIHHLPAAYLDRVMTGLRSRGLVGPDDRFTDAGRGTKDRIEALTDTLAAAPYETLPPAGLDELQALLQPIAARLRETGSR